MKNTSRKKFRLTKKVFAVPYILFLLLFVVVPLVLILVNAFLDSGSNLTLENFKIFFTSKSSLVVLGNSLLVGVITTVLCLVIGYPVAYFLSKMSSGRILVLLYVIPMGVNFLIRTLATKAIFIALGVELGMGTVLFGMVYNYLPFMILPLHTTLSGIDKSYIEAALDLGANPFKALTKVMIPIITPGIVSGFVMAFIMSMDDFIITQINKGAATGINTLSTFIYSDARVQGLEPFWYAIFSIIFVVVLAAVLSINLVKISREKKKNKEKNA